jgi:hypothetical protein
MALVSAYVIDNGLDVLDTDADKIFICSAEPTTYAEATVTLALGNKDFGAGAVASLSNASPNGRKATASAVSDGTITADGTATHWAIVDGAASRLLATGTLNAPVGLISGGAFTLPPFVVTLPAKRT